VPIDQTPAHAVTGRRTRGGPLAALAFALIWTGACAAGPAPTVLPVATTTSVDNSGLLAAILPAFEERHGVRVDVLAVGSGRALALVARGDAAAALTHDPHAEASALDAGTITTYRKIMFNDFLIVGPDDDPAGVGDAADATDAMRQIATSGATFVSRADGSGTHSREQELWDLTGQRPTNIGLLETGRGMSATLRVASERHGYTLTDRATFEQVRSGMALVPLVEEGPGLLNTYAIFLRAGLTGAERDAAVALADWLSDGEGRQLVTDFRANGQAVFNIWPAGSPRERPSDVPDAH
jgi:tungstate transport system substrate-binding protein